jgi:hypothetical protein
MQFSQLQQAMVGAARVQTLLQEAETPLARDSGEVRERRHPHRPPGLRLPARPAGAAGHRPRACRPAASTASSATPAAARARCCRCCCASTRRRPGASASTARRWSDRRGPLPRPRRPGAAGALPAGGHGAREHRDGPAADAMRRSRPRRAPRMRTTSSPRWSAATTRRWAKAARGCRSARSSCWRSRARWPASRASCSWTRPPRTSIRTPSRWCSARWRSCAAR